MTVWSRSWDVIHSTLMGLLGRTDSVAHRERAFPEEGRSGRL